MERYVRAIAATGQRTMFLLMAAIPLACLAGESSDQKAILGVNFTKVANNGTSLPDGAVLGAGATDWACTRHNASGLVFEVKVNAPGSLRHAGNTYSWRNSNAASNGGNAGGSGGGTCSGSTCDTESYIAAVNAAGLCGGNNWRLPTHAELQRIVGFASAGTGAAVVDSTFFPNLVGGDYWARSNVAAIPTHAWAVSLGDGNARPEPKTQAFRIIVVR